jgi:hypothetical protein
MCVLPDEKGLCSVDGENMSTKQLAGNQEYNENPSNAQLPMRKPVRLPPRVQTLSDLLDKEPVVALATPRQLVYAEDDQCWKVDLVIFTTNCPWSPKALEALSWIEPSAGRFSVSFGAFASLLRQFGYSCQEEERLPQNSFTPDPDVLVKGADGNY